MATNAAISAFVRTYSDPGGSSPNPAFVVQQNTYAYRWAYYNNSAFDDLFQWSTYKSKYRLYRFTRGIYNPAARLVDFYAGSVYPGRLSAEKDVKSAIPLNKKTPDELRIPLAQLYQWSNWQAGKSVLVRYGAALGDVLTEIVDNMDNGTVTLQNVWPGHVSDLELDAMGNVKMYTIEYDAIDDAGITYKYKKVVDGSAFTFYRDDQQTSSYANPYGFVPACWTKHRDEGSDRGASAMRMVNKWDELNSLASQTHDQLHKLLAAPVLIGGTGAVSRLDAAQTRKQATSDEAPTSQESLNVLKGPADVSMHSIQLPSQEPFVYIEKLLGEIEADHPELSFYHQLREMSQVTGPAAARLMGDVQALLCDAQASYDEQMRKAIQMAIAIGGWRLSQGFWPNPTRQQQAFAGFDLDSYDRGDLDFSIDERELIPLTELEKMELERQKLALEADRRGLNEANVPGQIANRLRAAA